MGQLGFMVMLQALADDGDDFDPSPFFGHHLEAIEIDADNTLRIRAGGGSMSLRDSGQSCCESRYMHTDDDLPYYVGAKLMGLELRDGPRTKNEHGECEECQFLLVRTDRGDITIANYNHHNGYYGGFLIAGLVEKGPSATGPVCMSCRPAANEAPSFGFRMNFSDLGDKVPHRPNQK